MLMTAYNVRPPNIRGGKGTAVLSLMKAQYRHMHTSRPIGEQSDPKVRRLALIAFIWCLFSQ